MPADRVDVLFVVDSSGSMKSCFNNLVQHLYKFLVPLERAHFASIRLGLLAYKSIKRYGDIGHQHTVLAGSDASFMRMLYADSQPMGLVEKETPFFTRNTERFLECLRAIQPSGNENSLLALDTAADFPFEPASTTRRAVIWFSDERFHRGVTGNAPLEKALDICRKYVKRKIMLYAFAPHSPTLEEHFGRLPRVCINNIVKAPEGSSVSTWDMLDFSSVMESIGQSISVSALSPTMARENYIPASYGQNNEATWNEHWYY